MVVMPLCYAKMFSFATHLCVAICPNIGSMAGPTEVARILAMNLRSLMNASAGLRTQMAVAKASHGALTQTTVSRILLNQHRPTIDTLASLAKVFDMAPWQLLVPQLDPANPPTLRQPQGAEAEFYRRLQDLAAELGINGNK